MQKKEPKIAIVCDWLTNLGGAERVVLDMHKAFPDAPIYTTLYNKKALPQFKNAKVITSWLQKIPGASSLHQLLLPLMPRVFESFDLSEYDIVLSSSFACSKGIITGTNTTHICYCHNPTRYYWDESHEFFKRYQWPRLLKELGKFWVHKLRKWDYIAAQRPDYYLANSNFVKNRIKKYYGRDSEVLYPGVSLNEAPQTRGLGEYYLAVGRMTAQKYFDLTVKAFNELQLPLKIVGKGNLLPELKKLNTSQNTEFLGFVSDQELIDLYRNAKALIYPQCEDFGITPLEAQSQGCPIIAYNAGGARETVLRKPNTGILFNDQTTNILVEAVKTFEKREETDYKDLSLHAQEFSSAIFREKLKAIISRFIK